MAGATVMNTCTTTIDDRARLRFFAGELAKARDAVADVDARLDRLVTIVRDADAAYTALQEAVASDGGVALAAYAAGEASDAPIARLIVAQENTARASAAAKTALPNTQAMLNAARAEVVRLEQDKEKATLEYLTARADGVALQYRRLYQALCRSHDQLVGISHALSSGDYGGDIVMGTVAMTVPRFNLPSTAHPNEYLPTMTHLADADVVQDVNAHWQQARNRLAQDVNAELDDILGPQVEKEA